MLTLTDRAAKLVSQLTEVPLLEENGGLRLYQRDGGGSFGVSLAVEPGSTDSVSEAHGARVFVAAELQEFLADKILDAEDQDGKVRFRITATE